MKVDGGEYMNPQLPQIVLLISAIHLFPPSIYSRHLFLFVTMLGIPGEPLGARIPGFFLMLYRFILIPVIYFDPRP